MISPEDKSAIADLAARTLLRKTDHFWLNLQTRYDIEMERDRLGKRLEKEVEILRKVG